MSQVLSTQVLHAWGALDLVDGSAAADSPVLRADGAFTLALDAVPRGLRVQIGAGRLAFLSSAPSTTFLPHARDGADLIDLAAPAGTLAIVARAADAPIDCGDQVSVMGAADDGLRALPARPQLIIAGIIADPAGRWLPRRFARTLMRGALTTLPVWPAPAATPGGTAGTFSARLWFGDDQGLALTPAAYALAQLDIDLAPGLTRTFRAMADAHGDLVIAPGRIPPTPSGLAGYAARLSVRAQPSGGSPPAPPDPDALPARMLGDPVGRQPGGAVHWLGTLPFTFAPGRRQRLDTALITTLLVQQP